MKKIFGHQFFIFTEIHSTYVELFSNSVRQLWLWATSFFGEEKKHMKQGSNGIYDTHIQA